jgi:hypothetical protein
MQPTPTHHHHHQPPPTLPPTHSPQPRLELLVDGATATAASSLVELEVWAAHFLRPDSFKVGTPPPWGRKGGGAGHGHCLGMHVWCVVLVVGDLHGSVGLDGIGLLRLGPIG